MIKIFKGGCESRQSSDFRMNRPHGISHFVLLVVRSHAEFQIGDSFFRIIPPSAVLLAPSSPHTYGNPQGDYSDDWLHFETDEPAFLPSLWKISDKPFPVIDRSVLTFCIYQLVRENSYGEEPYKTQNISALFTLLYNHLINSYENSLCLQPKNLYQRQLENIRMEMENSIASRPTIRDYAARLNVSESYFQYLYKQLFGISFQQDLIQMRISYAKELLRDSSFSMGQIAELCGYANETHFYRQFRKYAQLTPCRYKKSLSDSGQVVP